MSQRNFSKSFPLLFVLSAICSANPVWYRSIDGYTYLIESDLKVIIHNLLYTVSITNLLIPLSVQLASVL